MMNTDFRVLRSSRFCTVCCNDCVPKRSSRAHQPSTAPGIVTVAAPCSGITGSVLGGLISFLVHTILSGGLGVLVVIC